MRKCVEKSTKSEFSELSVIVDNFVDNGENYAEIGDKMKIEPLFYSRNCENSVRDTDFDRYG